MKNLKLFLFTLVAVFAVGFAVNVNAEGNVAKIGETEYATLQAAINAVEDGQTVVLLQDVEENPTIDGKDFVLDLGENTLTVGGYGVDTYESTLVVINGTVTVDEGFGFYLNNGNTFTLDTTAKINGTGTGVMSDLYPANAEVDNTVVVNGEINVEGTAIVLDNASTLIVNEGAKVIGTNGILVADETTTVDEQKIELNKNASTVTVNGYVAGSNVGVTVNGNITSNTEYPTITIGSKAEIVTDGEETVGLYLAGYGKTVIADGARLSGTAGAVEVRSGDLTINGGTFTSTYNGEAVVVTPNGNGSTTVGAALAIAQHSTKLPVNVTINGGTFNGVAAVYESNPQENPYDDISKVHMSITAGTFNATSEDPIHSEDVAGFISGGVYNVSPDPIHVAEGYAIFNVAGTYLVNSNSIESAVITGIQPQTYNGKAQRQNIVVDLNGTTLIKDTDYTVGYSNLTNAGTITMTIKGIGKYSGKVTKTFVRNKAKNTLTVKVANKTVYYSKVKKAAQVVKPITIVKKQGTVTYTKMSGSSAKLLLNKTTGKVTVKKGTKKGKYKIRIKIAASGNTNYKSAYGIRTIYVTVK